MIHRHRPRALVAAGLACALVAMAAPGVLGSTEPAATVVRKPKLEKLALRLLNCNRTGGKIRRNGTCKARGSGRFSAYRKPLKRHLDIGNRVAWPWAKVLVIENECAHDLDGYPGVWTRFGTYDGAARGENVGCTWGMSARDMVTRVSRAFQAEKWHRGGHWRNLKSTSLKSVGIGVAVSGTSARIVYDFYGRKP